MLDDEVGVKGRTLTALVTATQPGHAPSSSSQAKERTVVMVERHSSAITFACASFSCVALDKARM